MGIVFLQSSTILYCYRDIHFFISNCSASNSKTCLYMVSGSIVIMDTDTPFDLSCHSRLNIAQASSQLYAALFENTIYLVIVTSVNLYFQYNCNLVIFGPDRSILI